jgi:hypothetical protein
MANIKPPVRVDGPVRLESDLSQILAHGPAMRDAYGKTWGGLLMLVAIMKASRGPIGIIAAVIAVCTLVYRMRLG